MSEDDDDSGSPEITETEVDRNRTSTSERAEDDSDNEGSEYEVEAILRVKAFVKENVVKYQVRWVGYTEDYDSWEPEENLLGAEEALKVFKQTHAAEMERALKTLEKRNKTTPKEPTSEGKKAVLRSKRAEKSLNKVVATEVILSSDDEELIFKRRRDGEGQVNGASNSNANGGGKSRLVTVDGKQTEKIKLDKFLDGRDGKFVTCVKKSDGSIHILRSSGETRCLMPIKEAHERYGFELVEYLISRAEFE